MADSSGFSKEQAKEHGRRQVYLIFFLLLILATIFTINEESDMTLHVLDDYILVTVSVVALAVMGIRWKRTSAADMRTVNNVLAALALIGLIAVVFAFTQEINDPADFGNDPPQLIAVVSLLVNRFV